MLLNIIQAIVPHQFESKRRPFPKLTINYKVYFVLNLIMKLLIVLILLSSLPNMLACKTPTTQRVASSENGIITGADQTGKYVAYLKGKRVGILANPTTVIGKKHLVDSLKSVGINITKVFGPEHGFR